jgi:hypothetical protein
MYTVAAFNYLIRSGAISESSRAGTDRLSRTPRDRSGPQAQRAMGSLVHLR